MPPSSRGTENLIRPLPQVVMLWRTEGPVELALRPEGGPDLAQARHTSLYPCRNLILNDLVP